MQKIIILPALLLITLYSQAQHLQLRPLAAFGHAYENNLGKTNIFGTEANTIGKSQFKPSYAIGIGMSYTLGTHWAIGADMMYSKEGRNIRYRSHYDNYDFNDIENIYYLRLPVHVSYYFGKQASRLRPYAGAGLSFGILLNQTFMWKANNAQTADYLSRVSVIVPGADNFDIGWVVNAGCQYQLNSKAALFSSLKYYHGITGQDWFNQRNRNLRIELGYSLSLN